MRMHARVKSTASRSLTLLPVILFITLLSLCCGQQEQETQPGFPFYIVDIQNLSAEEQLAVRACAGLYNRPEHLSIPGNKAVYLHERQQDETWIKDIDLVDDVTFPQAVMPAAEFLPLCMANRAIVKGYIRYSLSGQQAIMPNIVTLAAVLDAIPIYEFAPISLAIPSNRLGSSRHQTKSAHRLAVSDLLQDSGLPLVFDATQVFADFTPLQATRYVFDNYGQQTRGGMAKMDPGYQPTPRDDDFVPEDWGLGEFNPQLIPGNANLGLSDFIIQQRIFAFYLWFGCIEGNPEEELVSFMTNPTNNNWPTPIPVYGYEKSFTIFEGDVFEANTNCADHRNMGSIPTENVNNLSFFSRVTGPGAAVRVPAVSEELTYNPAKTYIALVVGDGDNMAFVKGSRREWMVERVRYCNDTPQDQQILSLANGRPAFQTPCYPLLWTLSPHLVSLAPEILKWYQDQAQAATGGLDTFILPPSGHLYSYPGTMTPSAQAEFVRLTEQDALNFNTNAMVSWEWVGTWYSAFANYFPRYVSRGIITAVLAMNVPYPLPFISYPFPDTYRIVGNKMAVFEPLIWRGTDERDPREYHLSPANMAAQINAYPKGDYINFMYATSDGGFTISDFHELIPLLDDHVEVVDSKQLASLALQRGVQNNSNNAGGSIVEDVLSGLPDVLGNLVNSVLPSSSSSRAGQAKPSHSHSDPDFIGF